MTTSGKKTMRPAGAGLLARLRRPAAAWIAALALVLQLGASAAHAPAGASSAELAAAALSAAIGQQVSLCAEGDHSGAPDHSSPCCADCALCGVACRAGALAPARAALPIARQRAVAIAFTSRADAAPRTSSFFSSARSRAPPVPV